MTEIESMEIKCNVPWGHIAARTYGPSTGKPVLMVHGYLDNAGSFTRLIKYLPAGYYYVCIDLPGHGWSSHFPSWQRVDFMDYVHMIHFILEALQWQTCIYIGHSMGAQLGIIFSTLQPHRFKKIISLDGIIPPPPTKEEFMESFKDIFMLAIKANSNQAEPFLYTKEEILHALENLRISPLNPDAVNALFERAVTEINGKYKYNRDIRLKAALSLMDIDQFIPILHAVTVPLHIILVSQGIQRIFQSNMHKIISSMNPKALIEIIYIDGVHDVHNNNPEIVGPLVYKMLNSDNSSKL